MQGFCSGIRSALVLWEGRCYRLKGCGNREQGFLLREALDDRGEALLEPGSGQPLQQIRGSCYLHTVLAELAMSARVDSLLAEVGMRCANRPLGWYRYVWPELPRVPRCCGVFETVGDRRLCDHVLRGLETLLPRLFSAPRHHEASVGARLRAALPPGPFGARLAPDTLEITELAETHLVVSCSGPHDRATPARLADLCGVALGMSLRPDMPAAPAGLPRRFGALWASEWEALVAARGDRVGPAQRLASLYWRFGRECGTVARRLAQAGIAWGTFRDGSGTHCNAHGNNMVLCAETGAGQEGEGEGRPYLAPLDFDLAYETGSFRSRGPEGVWRADPGAAEEHIRFEAAALALDLGGYQGSSGTRNDHVITGEQGALCNLWRWVLRDTMVRGYLEAVFGLEDRHPEVPGQRKQAYHLLRLAVLATWDVEA